jgi:cytoskeleton protein RodZ
MESVGQKLRATRLQLGLSLEDISDKTRISTRNLRAIENDELSSVGPAFFYKSFVRQFAQQLKIDYNDLAAAVQSVTSSMPEPLMPGQTEAAAVLSKVPALRPSRPKKLRWLYSFTSLVVMLVACSSIYSSWRNSRSQLQAMVASAIPSLIDTWQDWRATKNPVKVAQTNQPVSVAAPTKPLADPPAPQNALFHVELSALEPTWLSIVADGRQTFDGILEAAQTQILEGREMARVRTGNAGGLNIVFNGKAIGSLGAHGQVQTVVFTKDGYETLGSSVNPAAHLALTQFIPTVE